ncbi:ATP-grasp domain-containing protein [Sulfurisphaera tokodaii]|uniref:Alpha-L-glutamate ligase n=1 Tax=Sulfurisphaera tokodaii (strain DSM 16993 / JCM 10545 / NBRC 100140 / 7) TaxID=273063 RepID=Q975C0_SULTO|nr:putative alpha-L-glutamate ligase [Sulfurisphaera tokodaii str. 7]
MFTWWIDIRIAVIHESQKITESAKQLLLEIKNTGNTPIYIRISKLNPIITKDGLEFSYGGKRIDLDGAVIRNLGFISSTEQLMKRFDTLKALESSGVTLINSPDSMFIARDKFNSLLKLKMAKVPVPDTTIVEDPFEVMRLVNEWKDVVIKPVIGSLGLGSVRVSDPDIAFRVAKAILSVNQPVYVQKYVDKPERDIRVFVVGNSILGSVYRINKSSWKTNVAQGSLTQVLLPNHELEELSLKAVKALKLDYAGIDIVEDKDGSYKVIEVNAAPLWKGFYEATHINPAKYIIEYLIKKIRK